MKREWINGVLIRFSRVMTFFLILLLIIGIVIVMILTPFIWIFLNKHIVSPYLELIIQFQNYMKTGKFNYDEVKRSYRGTDY